MKIVSKDEAEEATVVICSNARWPNEFPDNVVTDCAECGTKIMHRPHAPSKPKKVCNDCGEKLMANDNDVQLITTNEVITEVIDKLSPKNR